MIGQARLPRGNGSASYQELPTGYHIHIVQNGFPANCADGADLITLALAVLLVQK